VRFKGQTFEGEEIQLDFNEFVDCRFVDCRFVFYGYGTGTMSGNTLERCSLAFDGPARITMQFVREVYHGMQGGRELVEAMFDAVRRDDALPIHSRVH
jgi:hypothetical protein